MLPNFTNFIRQTIKKKIAYVCAKKFTLFWGKAFDSKRAGKNNDDCVLKGISKKQFYFKLSGSTFHINSNFWLNAVGPIKHSYRELFGEFWRSGANYTINCFVF